jgi:hypothetical protein
MPPNPYEDLEPDRPQNDDSESVTHVGDGALLVCTEELPDGSICGETFANKIKLNGHKTGKHRDRSGDKPRAKRASSGTSHKAKPRAAAKDPVEKATDRATGPSTSRTTTYAQSLALIWMLGYFAIPPMDDYDLGVLNNGTPNLATALDLVGAENEAFRKGCDLILGGGTGGAYVALVFAIAGIAGPIATHHKLLPAGLGNALAATSGAATPTAVPEPTPPAESGEPKQGVWDPNTPEGVLAFMSGVPPTVLGDLTGKMMSMDQATTVVVPTFPTEAPPDAPGSEQLKPTLLDGLLPDSEPTEAESVRVAP